MIYWTHILSLLTFAVLIDERVYKEEVECFTDQALKLQMKITPDMLFSQKMAFDWFLAHREAKLALLKSGQAKTALLEPITALENSPDRAHVLAAIQSIAQADGELHDKETNLVKLCKTHWRV